VHTISQTRIDQPLPKELSETKIVDEQGLPIVLYHGTTAQFDRFSDHYLQSLGFHIGDPAQADHFAGPKPGGRVFPVYVVIRNPLDLGESDSGWQRPQATAVSLVCAGVLSFSEGVRIVGSDDFSLASYRHIEPQAQRQERNKQIIHALERKGYDGVLYTNTQEPRDGIARRAYLVFHANQIYSAITLECLGED
jgi:ADP-Ribosyltransferase in polyvalent proteins